MKPLFCGNFEYETRQPDLERAFSKYGRVERVDMKSGFAFVYFDDERDAADAIRGLNDRPFGYSKRRLSVEWARGDRGSRHREGSKSMANHRPTKTLFVINFDPIQTRITDIERHFEPYGKVLHVRIRRNFAFVQFETQEEATDALEHTHMSKILDRVVSVEYALRDDDERDRRDSPRRGYGGRRGSPYGRSRSPVYRSSRPSPDYGRGRSRPSPDYGCGRSRPSPDYGRRQSPEYGEVRSPDYGRARSPGYGRPRSPSYGRPRSPGNGHPLSPDYRRVHSPVGSPDYGRARSPVSSPDYGRARSSVRSPDYGHVSSPLNDCARSHSCSPVNGHARSPSSGCVQSPGNGHACSPDYGRSRSPGYPHNGELSPEFDRERSGSPVRRSTS